MADLRTPEQMRSYEDSPAKWRRRSSQGEWSGSRQMSPAWTIVGVGAAVLLGLAVYHFGPDFKRYLKIERM